jgi:hypothetical protein
MTQKVATTIEEKILKDGSLSEERKAELLRLVATMKPEMTNSRKSEKETKGVIRSSEHSSDRTTLQERKHKDA